MNPLLVIGLLFGVAVGVTVYKTVKAAKTLSFNVLRFGLYQFNNDGRLVFRARVKITNPQDTPIHINLIDVYAYLNSRTAQVNGETQIIDSGNLIASVSDANGFTIEANGFTEKDLYINAKWSDVGKYFLNNWQDYFNIFTGAVTLRDFVNQFIGQPVLLVGNIKAEGYNIQLAEIVQLSNDTE